MGGFPLARGFVGLGLALGLGSREAPGSVHGANYRAAGRGRSLQGLRWEPGQGLPPQHLSLSLQHQDFAALRGILGETSAPDAAGGDLRRKVAQTLSRICARPKV